jgi:hypothetical protein
MATRNPLPKVRLVREFVGQRGTLWREYANERGQRIVVEARGPGGRRAASKAVTAREAAQRFAGYL